jgi:hypothetical protein
VAEQPQPLDAVPLIRRKRAGEGGQQSDVPEIAAPQAPKAPSGIDETPLRMKPRDLVQLAAVHVRIPEQLARGLRLMSVLEGRQAQVIVAEMLEDHLTKWNPRWRESVPPKEG